ncbi:hypothetical protein VTN00DRAFT_7840 [Thermoascus crustaceus]|uniref:uncharacterized protein n=1 Tax=Thermoascus crustaceus TaxID=5088 RepID=UPI003742792E
MTLVGAWRAAVDVRRAPATDPIFWHRAAPPQARDLWLVPEPDAPTIRVLDAAEESARGRLLPRVQPARQLENGGCEQRDPMSARASQNAKSKETLHGRTTPAPCLLHEGLESRQHAIFFRHALTGWKQQRVTRRQGFKVRDRPIFESCEPTVQGI